MPARRSGRNIAGGLQLREPGRQRVSLCQDLKKTRGCGRGQGFAQFAAHPFRRDGRQSGGGQGAHLSVGSVVHLPVRPLGREAGQTEDPRWVVGQGRGRGGPQAAGAQIGQGLGMEAQQAAAVQSHGIDGEIPGQKVRFQAAAAQGHAFPAAPEADTHAFAHRPGVGMGGQKIGHVAGKSEIQLNGHAAQQEVAHGPAHEVKFHEFSMPQPGARGKRLRARRERRRLCPAAFCLAFR